MEIIAVDSGYVYRGGVPLEQLVVDAGEPHSPNGFYVRRLDLP